MWRDWWLDVLQNSQLDLMMLQDGYGRLQKPTFTHIKDYFTKVKEACLIRGKKLWDDIEIYKQIPPETPFQAIPGNMVTIASQIDATSTIVSTNVSFEFPFYMSPRDFLWGSDSGQKRKLYYDYSGYYFETRLNPEPKWEIMDDFEVWKSGNYWQGITGGGSIRCTNTNILSPHVNKCLKMWYNFTSPYQEAQFLSTLSPGEVYNLTNSGHITIWLYAPGIPNTNVFRLVLYEDSDGDGTFDSPTDDEWLYENKTCLTDCRTGWRRYAIPLKYPNFKDNNGGGDGRMQLNSIRRFKIAIVSKAANSHTVYFDYLHNGKTDTNLAYFQIIHDGEGEVNVPEIIKFIAKNRDGETIKNYSGTITLYVADPKGREIT